MVRRLAVLVGCNYAGTKEIRGSFNNVELWRQRLLSRFGFNEQGITVMTDDDVGGVMPTREKIWDALNNMVNTEQANAGDVFFFHFSGQGTLDSDHPAIVASDLKLVTDMDFRTLVDSVPTYASFTILADCSHSGGLIHGEKRQIPPEPPFPCQPDAGILLSACDKNEKSNEIDVAGKTYGAFTNVVVKTILDPHPDPISNKELVTSARAELSGQHPCLYCSDDNANAPFLRQLPNTT